jgi:hypothetical protein
MIETLSHHLHNILLAVIAMFVAWFGVLHAATVSSRMLRHLVSEMRRQLHELRDELLEWRRFFRGP